MLGFSSDFPVRQLEKDGRLHAVRGAMGQAWYPRAEVLALLPSAVEVEGRIGEARSRGPGTGGSPSGRWTDAALIAHLREMVVPSAGGPPRPRTVVDLVADAGVSISRAERIYRFWLAHDLHPVAQALRRARDQAPGTRMHPEAAPSKSGVPEGAIDSGPGATAGAIPAAGAVPVPAERRGGDRMERDTLIRQLRHADPAVRARAFAKLKHRRGSR